MGLVAERGLVTAQELVEEANGYLSERGLEPITYDIFRRSMHSVWEKMGNAESVGGKVWLYDSALVADWCEYVAKRQRLIKAGIWSEKRPYAWVDALLVMDEEMYRTLEQSPVRSR